MKNLGGYPLFLRSELLEREGRLIEYVSEHVAPIVGSNDIQGDSPKFLLEEDKRDRWHTEGTVIEGHIKQHCLVEFPRGRNRVIEVFCSMREHMSWGYERINAPA